MSDEIILQADTISRSFHGKQILFDVSFQLRRGEILGLLGPNGAGKSTTMKILCGVLAPHSGSVTVCGSNLAGQSARDPRSHIGYLPEDPPLYLDATVDEYLEYCAALKRVPARHRVTAREQAKSLCGLVDVGARLIDNLSKGYKQRIGIAQAILHQPDVLVLDEPTNGLDPNQIRDVRHLIQTLAQRQALIISTHVLSEVQMLCDRVLIIDHGKIVYDEPIERAANELLVGYAAPPPPDFSAALRGVDAMRALDDRRFLLQVADRHDVTEQLLAQSLELGLGLVELGTSASSLEQTFFDLTCNDGGYPAASTRAQPMPAME